MEGENQSLLDKLETIQPFLGSLNSRLKLKEEENKKLNYLYSLETSLQARSLENQQYEERVKVAESKWDNAEKKLEKVKDLVASGQIMKLMELVKKGQI